MEKLGGRGPGRRRVVGSFERGLAVRLSAKGKALRLALSTRSGAIRRF